MSCSAVDVDWCLACDRHLDAPGLGYCSTCCEPSPSRRVLKPTHHNDDEYDDDYLYDEPVIYHDVKDTSRAPSNDVKNIAAWAARVPAGAPPTSTTCSSSPKLLHVQSSRPVPPALSMSGSASTSTSIATPPSRPTLPHRNSSVLSAFANHVRSFVSSSAVGFPAARSKTRTRSRAHNLSTVIHQLHHRTSSVSSSVSSADDVHDSVVASSPTSSPFEDKEDLWWVTESDCSSPVSTLPKKSRAQLISRKHETESCFAIQPTKLPIPASLLTRSQEREDDEDEDDRHSAWKSRGRRSSRPIDELL